MSQPGGAGDLDIAIHHRQQLAGDDQPQAIPHNLTGIERLKQMLHLLRLDPTAVVSHRQTDQRSTDFGTNQQLRFLISFRASAALLNTLSKAW